MTTTVVISPLMRPGMLGSNCCMATPVVSGRPRVGVVTQERLLSSPEPARFPLRRPVEAPRGVSVLAVRVAPVELGPDPKREEIAVDDRCHHPGRQRRIACRADAVPGRCPSPPAAAQPR